MSMDKVDNAIADYRAARARRRRAWRWALVAYLALDAGCTLAMAAWWAS